MPGAHRNNDLRFCMAKTIVTNQGSVYVNGKLWAVEGDQSNHLHGELVHVYGGNKVYCEGKLAIVAVGDIALPDMAGHPAPPTDPATASGDVFAYTGEDVAVT